MTTLTQWQSTLHKLNALNEEPSTRLFTDIIARYREPHRHYHTLRHLDECFDKLSELGHLAKRLPEIEFALWFHDAVYDPNRHDNEQLSANWAQASAINSGLRPGVAGRIYKLVMATQHRTIPKTTDEKILIDVDLAILATEPNRFREYEQQIRTEYGFVPAPLFRAKRQEILQNFLSRKTIFHMPIFVERYEQQARINLNHALERL